MCLLRAGPDARRGTGRAPPAQRLLRLRPGGSNSVQPQAVGRPPPRGPAAALPRAAGCAVYIAATRAASVCCFAARRRGAGYFRVSGHGAANGRAAGIWRVGAAPARSWAAFCSWIAQSWYLSPGTQFRLGPVKRRNLTPPDRSRLIPPHCLPGSNGWHLHLAKLWQHASAWPTGTLRRLLARQLAALHPTLHKPWPPPVSGGCRL